MFALHLACSAGLISAIYRLLEGGCDVNEEDRSYSTPLYHACFEAHLQISQELLARGADVNARGTPYGKAPQAASAGGHEQIVNLLGGRYGNALQAALYRGHEHIMKLLVNKNAIREPQGVPVVNSKA
ncbi:ankyrin [Delitschia confertaspora ATCC 74209]|uniref:Ankyrin n=1 Tax=Delitschia confertaspora ATCC 74209 TaxID=1513339 RepID=A0A9P4MQ00_9PLEO|nr:ankyrin [Delitschia confertaspora ATCC 74209]